MSDPILGDRRSVTSRTPMPVQDVTNSTSKTQVSSEAVSFSDGAAGTTQRLKLTYDGIMSQYGDRLGTDGDTSLSFGTGTVLTTEVPWRFKNVPGQDTETARLASLSNGEYMVDYENGYILGKSAVLTASTTDTVNYKVRLAASTVVGGGDASAANQTLQLAQETAAASSLSTLDDWDEADRAKVSLIPGQTGVAGGPGASDAGTLRVVLSTDSNSGIADQTAFTVGTTKGSLIMAEADESGPDSVSEGDVGALRMTLTRFLKTSMGDLLAGEDLTNNKMVVEHQYSYSAVAVVDTQVKASAGFLHSVTISCNDAAPTAGSLIIYDNTAESGTVVFNHTFTTTPFVPFSCILDVVMATGIYVGMTTTGDVNFSVSYR